MTPHPELDDGSRIAVMGGGPAGSFFSYFLVQLARRAGLDVRLDIYEPRDFSAIGPKGCNMCGGIVSESLVQSLAAEGINLPPTVVQRGIDSYFLHMDVGSVRIETPLQEMRIAAVHRGAGPRGSKGIPGCRGLDGFLLELAVANGANLVRKRVDGIDWPDGRPRLKSQDSSEETYDLLAVATGVNTPALKLFENSAFGYAPPRSTKTYICEIHLGREVIARHLGTSMHVFLLNIPRLEFAALIPKGDYVTLCLLGEDIDKELIESFLHAPEVRRCLPPGWQFPDDFCHCSPKLSIRGAVNPFADRVIFLGDCGVTRLYKDGIGAAYRTAKAAAVTAVFEGIGGEDFRRHFWLACRYLARDNLVGRVVFMVTRQIQLWKFLRRGVWRMVAAEQQEAGSRRRMSMVLWDTFTGSAPYRSVFLRSLHPAFLGRLLWETLAGLLPRHLPRQQEERMP
ncbi:MAG: NAD(P)/FAD-dependent oxidoreductase [Terriglobia bacterium]